VIRWELKQTNTEDDAELMVVDIKQVEALESVVAVVTLV
jgi:hypothetical protein